MVQVVEQNPTDLILVLADMARANPPLTGAFLAELTRHLQGQSPHFAFANSWLEHRLAEQGLTIEQLVRADGQAQAADQVSIGNSISSLRFLSSNDWRDVRRDAQPRRAGRCATIRRGVYADMDFATRDRYRHVVEEIARRSPLAGARRRAQGDPLARASADTAERRDVARGTAHVGYYLIDRGRPALELRAAHARLPVDARPDGIGALAAVPLRTRRRCW